MYTYLEAVPQYYNYYAWRRATLAFTVRLFSCMPSVLCFGAHALGRLRRTREFSVHVMVHLGLHYRPLCFTPWESCLAYCLFSRLQSNKHSLCPPTKAMLSTSLHMRGSHINEGNVTRIDFSVCRLVDVSWCKAVMEDQCAAESEAWLAMHGRCWTADRRRSKTWLAGF